MFTIIIITRNLLYPSNTTNSVSKQTPFHQSLRLYMTRVLGHFDYWPQMHKCAYFASKHRILSIRNTKNIVIKCCSNPLWIVSICVTDITWGSLKICDLSESLFELTHSSSSYYDDIYWFSLSETDYGAIARHFRVPKPS